MSVSRLIMSALVALTALTTVGCMRLDPDHPYDHDSPPEYRAKASVIGRLLLVDEPSGFSYDAFELILINDEFEEYTYYMPVNPDCTFQVDGVMPGDYTVTADGRVNVEGFERRYVLPRRALFLPVGEQQLVSTPYVLLPVERVLANELP